MSKKYLIFTLCLIFLCSMITPSPADSLHNAINGTESIISVGDRGTDQELPAIWGDRVVWRTIYPNPLDAEMVFSDIIMYNLSDGSITKITADSSKDMWPDIWEDLVVWSKYENGTYEIYIYNITTGENERITHDSVNQVKPGIWGDSIIWQQGDDTDPEMAVYLYNISTGFPTQLDAGSGFAMSPAIWEDRIVWQDGRNGNDFDIYFYNCTSGIETQITVDPASQMNPSIWQDHIVWEDPRGSYSHIYMYDLVSGNETQITSGEDNQFNPKIYENYVVYVNLSDIYLIDLSTMNEGKISSDSSDAVQFNPDIWGNRIIWTDSRNGDYDIFLFTIGIELPQLMADFNQNKTQGESPLIVAFTDMSSGQVAGWNWDFGDGNSTKEKNPIHTYSMPGSYSVALTVHNQWQRNGVLKEDLISVGTVPIPQFSVNQTRGPEPLYVQFTDESSGLPNEWKWEFGDGEISDEQYPIHIYGHAGLYNVSLTVSNFFGNTTLTKQELVEVKEGTYQICVLPSEGIDVNTNGGDPVLSLNTLLAGNCYFDPDINPGEIRCIPEKESGISQIIFTSKDGNVFSFSDNETVTGFLGQVAVSNYDLIPINFSQKVGNNCCFNFTVYMPSYPKEGTINLVTWEGSTPEELKAFNHISTDYNYVRVEDLAYTVRFREENITESPSDILFFGVSSDWVDQYGWRWCHQIESDPTGAAVFVDSRFVGDTPICIEEGLSPGNHTVTVKELGYYEKTFPITIDDKRDSIHVIRIGDDGTGEVLNTTFIGHDPERNLDFFRAESPNGLSTFGLASLSKSGNVLQLVNLVVSRVAGSGGGGGGGGSSAAASLASAQKTAAPTPAVPEPAETVSQLPEEHPAPQVTSLPGDTAAFPEAARTVTSEEPALSPMGSLIEGTSSLIILRNVSVIFVVIFVTVVFYLRWKKREE